MCPINFLISADTLWGELAEHRGISAGGFLIVIFLLFAFNIESFINTVLCTNRNSNQQHIYKAL